jgi:hypothetical protein
LDWGLSLVQSTLTGAIHGIETEISVIVQCPRIENVVDVAMKWWWFVSRAVIIPTKLEAARCR